MELNLELDRLSKTPLYIQIADQIATAICSGFLKAGSRLPAERKLAAQLGVNRSTIINTYGELEARGYVTSHVGQGTTITDSTSQQRVEAFPWHELLSGQGEGLLNPYSQAMSELLYRRDDFILMDSGIAAPELYPTQELADICREILLKEGAQILQHNSAQGLLSLRESLADLMTKREIKVSPEEIVTINGSQQGMDLIARILLEPGDCIIIEQPCYLGAIDIYRAYGTKLIAIPTDHEGMIVERLEKLLSRVRPKLIYTNPTYQNPSGCSMSMVRRRRLLELASRYQVPIVEDDPYGLLNYGAPGLPPLKALDTAGIVIYLGTMSKILSPGIRVGWMAAPDGLINLVIAAKQLIDLHNNNLVQRMVDLFYRRGLLDRHLTAIKNNYRLKRDAMLGALGEYAPEGMSWNHPEGGFFVWATLPPNVPALRLLQEAITNKITFVAGPAFYSSIEGQNKLRLNFTFSSPDSIRQGIQTLCRLTAELSARFSGLERATAQDCRPIV